MKKKKIRNKKEKGFSLIDVLIAMAILGFILLSIAQLMMVALYSENSARRHTTLLYYGQRQMEELLSLPFTDTQGRLNIYEVQLGTDTNGLCAYSNDVTEKNAACVRYESVPKTGTNIHRYDPPSGAYIVVWSVAQLATGTSRAITLYVIPNPPPDHGFKAPVILTGIMN